MNRIPLVLLSPSCGRSLIWSSRRRPEALLHVCGSGRFARGGFEIAAPPLRSLVLLAVASRQGAVCFDDELIELVYGHRFEGGPIDPIGSLGVLVHRDIRRDIASLGLRIARERCRGFVLVDCRPSAPSGASPAPGREARRMPALGVSSQTGRSFGSGPFPHVRPDRAVLAGSRAPVPSHPVPVP